MSAAAPLHTPDAENIFLPKAARIVRAVQTTETEKHFTLQLADGSDMLFEAGQILEVSLFGYGEIPIGLASSPTRKKTFDIVVRSVGRVSKAVNNLGDGDTLYVRGPLGHGFDLANMRGHDVLIVAAGIGLCPTRSLVQYIFDRRSEFKRFILFYGVREPKLQLFTEDLASWRMSRDVDFHETVDKTDPSWKGNVGVITTLIPKVELNPKKTVAVVVGPPIMYRFVIVELKKRDIADENVIMSLERRMKCGVGKCGHCQMEGIYVCQEGPVFNYAEVQDNKEVL